MSELLHQLVQRSAAGHPSLTAVIYKDQALDYRSLWDQVEQAAFALAGLGLKRRERVGVYLEKRLETVIAMFGAAAAGSVFVPINQSD